MYLPTHRGDREGRQDAIRLDNLSSEALHQLCQPGQRRAVTVRRSGSPAGAQRKYPGGNSRSSSISGKVITALGWALG